MIDTYNNIYNISHINPYFFTKLYHKSKKYNRFNFKSDHKHSYSHLKKQNT